MAGSQSAASADSMACLYVQGPWMIMSAEDSWYCRRVWRVVDISTGMDSKSALVCRSRRASGTHIGDEGALSMMGSSSSLAKGST
jgi:hypothetical protein